MLSHAVTLLTIASLLGHALLGCCGHHVHEQDGLAHDLCARSQQHADEADATGHEHGHDHDHVAATAVDETPRPLVLHSHWGGSPLADGTHDHDDDPCGEPPCAYVMPDASRVADAGDLPATTLPPCLMSRTSAESLLFARRTALEVSANDFHRDSARGRSLLGVWLL
jgi:hypothetical protein